MADRPRPYKGQNPKGPSDQWTTDHDLSNPDLTDGTVPDREPEDVLDPDAPAGAHDTADASKKAHVRWMRYENGRKQ